MAEPTGRGSAQGGQKQNPGGGQQRQGQGGGQRQGQEGRGQEQGGILSAAADVATQAREKAGEWASAAGERVESAKTTVGEGMESLAQTMRERGPQGGVLGSASHAVASGMERVGSYLQEHSFSDMGQDLTRLIRRYPVQAVLVGIGIGFLLSRATRS
jgi:hypothetical protein